jgi:hypothetical protein
MKHEVRIIGMLAAMVLISGMSVAAFQMNSTNYAISGVYGSAGGVSNSTNYSAVSAVSEPVVGYSNSTNFNLYSGIFYSFLIPPGEDNVTYDPCDLNHDGIVYRDWSDLMSAYKCFLGIGNCDKTSYGNWTAIKEEYKCFVNG